jgi:hypothetical protein
MSTGLQEQSLTKEYRDISLYSTTQTVCAHFQQYRNTSSWQGKADGLHMPRATISFQLSTQVMTRDFKMQFKSTTSV